jgi:rubrerythrin
MVSAVEKQLPPRHLQRYIEEEKENKETHQKTLNEKSIVLVQICYSCGRKFPFKKKRKRCPYCLSLLRTNTIILKIPQF